jgi:hypothetical protein
MLWSFPCAHLSPCGCSVLSQQPACLCSDAELAAAALRWKLAVAVVMSSRRRVSLPRAVTVTSDKRPSHDQSQAAFGYGQMPPDTGPKHGTVALAASWSGREAHSRACAHVA